MSRLKLQKKYSNFIIEGVGCGTLYMSIPTQAPEHSTNIIQMLTTRMKNKMTGATITRLAPNTYKGDAYTSDTDRIYHLYLILKDNMSVQ